MSAWVLTELGQFFITLIILLGGGFLLYHGGLDQDTAGMIKGLIVAWSGFWLGAKASARIAPPSSTTTTIMPSADKTAVQTEVKSAAQ